MTTIRRTSTATWAGGVESGAGHIGIGRTDVDLPFSLKTRIGAEPSTNPEELLGSALAGCYAMSLANELESNGTVAESITASATVHLTEGDGGFTIPTVDLDVVARVADVAGERFAAIARTAHESCPVANLYRADVRLSARVETT